MTGLNPYDPRLLIDVVKTRMPFGRYAGTPLLDLPEPYLVWFAQKGLPAGKLGEMMRIVLEAKTNGLMHLFDPLRAAADAPPDAPPAA